MQRRTGLTVIGGRAVATCKSFYTPACRSYAMTTYRWRLGIMSVVAMALALGVVLSPATGTDDHGAHRVPGQYDGMKA